MKKQTIMKGLLVLLPAIAVGLAMSGNSVILSDLTAGTAETYSYFDLMPVVEILALVTPMAGIAGIVSGGCAFVYLFSRKSSVLEVIRWSAFIGSLLAVLPVFRKADVMMLPHVAYPILLLVEFALATVMKKQAKKAEPEQRRLQPR